MNRKLPKYVQNLIANLRSISERYTTVSFDYQSVDSLIEGLKKRFKLEEARPQDVIMAHWKQIIGERHSHRCCPHSLTNGVLVIKVSNSVMRNELEFQKRKILDNVRQIAGCSEVMDIVFKAG